MTTGLNIVFAGTPEFAAIALRSLLASSHRVSAVYTQPDRPAGRGRKLTPSPVKSVALEHELPVYQPLSLKGEDEQRQLAALQPDVMVVAAYGLLLPKAVLDTPRFGCLNIHASLLPRWRGAAPIQRAILAGDAETGITIMQMDIGLDTGAMLHKVSTPILEEDTAATLHDRLAALGAQALLDTLEQLESGTLQPQEQDDSLANYAKKLEKSEAEMDWHRPATELVRQVAAFNPWPVAQTTFAGETLRIWNAKVIPNSGSTGQPGKIIHAGRDGVDVATGSGFLRLLTVQLPGGRPIGAADFANARSPVGMVLGNAE